MTTFLTSADNSIPSLPIMNEGNHLASHMTSNLKELEWSKQEQSAPSEQFDCPNGIEDISESRPENGNRDAAGKFTVGNPGGPGRLPAISVTEAIKADLRAGKAEVVKDKLFDLMGNARRESVQLAAAQELIDRAEGKATQNIRHAGVFLVAAPGVEALAALDGWANDE